MGEIREEVGNKISATSRLLVLYLCFYFFRLFSSLARSQRLVEATFHTGKPAVRIAGEPDCNAICWLGAVRAQGRYLVAR